MGDLSDWRLHGQERYLLGVQLARRSYRACPTNPSWDHDHCAFCKAEFSTADQPGVLHDGYCTADDYTWVCVTCFEDFRERFGWKTGPVPP
jgi:hypothetical protein